MQHRQRASIVKRAGQRLLAVVGAVAITFMFFLVLPVIQAIGEGPDDMVRIQEVDSAGPEPPPPPPEEEVEEEPEEEEPPPEMIEEAPPLDLSQLELALNPGLGDGWFGGDFTMQLNTIGGAGGSEELFRMTDLDQKPRCIYQPGPQYDPKVRKHAPGKAIVKFIVDERGSVQSPKIDSSSDPVFDRPAINAVKQWRFEPGKRAGKAVPYPMKITISFAKD